jgi:transcription elongation factor Elf1
MIPLSGIYDQYGNCHRCGSENVPVHKFDYGANQGKQLCLVCGQLPRLEGNMAHALAVCTLLILKAIHEP